MSGNEAESIEIPFIDCRTYYQVLTQYKLGSLISHFYNSRRQSHLDLKKFR